MDHKKKITKSDQWIKLFLAIGFVFSLLTSPVHAVIGGGGGGSGGQSLGRIGGGGLGPFGNIGLSITSGMAALTSVVSSIIGLITIAAGIWFLLQILIAGIGWLSSGGDKQKLTEAKDRLTNAGIGLVIVVAGWAILALASLFFGVSFLDPAAIIGNIQFK